MDAILPNYMGYNLFIGDLNNLPASPKMIINTINQYSFCIAEEDKVFKKALQEAEVLLPDGIGIVVAVKATTGQTIKKISGAQLHHHLLTKLNDSRGKCFYLGSSPATLKKIREHLATEFPEITCETYSPAYKPIFSEQENAVMIEKINYFKPDVLFVGMTAPKQEKWASDQKERINARVICSIGAVFDFYAGTVKRPGTVWINMGLEWFIRLCREPKRMWKRYLYYGPIFIYIIVKESMKLVRFRQYF